jgi:APA family basic amino acid/polyamine antiporter
VLGTLDTTAVVVGAIIGVGIFFTPSSVARVTGDGGLALLAWGLAGVIALCGALVFAELGGTHHGEGAHHAVLRDAYGPLPAFLFVVCNATAVQAGAIGIIALVCARHLALALGAGELQGGPLLAAACALVIGLVLANAAGVRWGARIQNLTTLAKLATLASVGALAFAARGGGLVETALGGGAAGQTSSLGPVGAVCAGLVPALFAFGGWQQSLWVAGEVRTPRRTLPRAIVGGVAIVVVAYLITNIAFLGLLGAEGVADSRTLASDAVREALPGVQAGLAARLVAGAVAISAFGVLNAQLLAGPYLLLGLARDGRFFAPFARRSARFGTPVASIVLLGALALGLLFAAGENGIDRLLTGVVFVDGVFFVLSGAALFVLRRKQRDAERPFQVPLYPLVPALFVLGEVGVLCGAALDPDKRGAAVIGALWIAGAALLYAVCFRGKRAGD